MMKPIALTAAIIAALGCASDARPPTQRSVTVTPDVLSAPTDAFTAPDSIPLPDRPQSSCGGTRVNLRQQRAEVVLVVDRSGSMNEPDSTGTRKWPTLLSVLHDVLPSIQESVALGLVLFPSTQVPMATSAQVCGTPSELDPRPTFNNASGVLSVLDLARPGGGTPTHDAVALAAQYFDRSPDPLGRRYVVLATDGAPNCNLTLDPTTCVCAGPAGTCTPTPGSGPITNCLDDTRTIETIRALATRGIQTFVVGLLGVESFTNVLDAMAVAGGRPRATAPRYFAATDRTELATALRGITTTLVDCRFRLEGPPPDPNLVDVRLGGTSLIHDVSHRDGWDWTDDTHLEVTFHGPTCDHVRGASGGEVLAAVFGCPAAVPP